MKAISAFIALALLGGAGVAAAQLGQVVPAPGGLLDPVRGLADPVGATMEATGRATVAATVAQSARLLESARIARIADLARAYPDAVALDPDGNAARAHEVVVDDPDDTLVAAAAAQGFRLIAREEALGVGYARFVAPGSMPIGAAMAALRRLGAREVSADQIHFQSGAPDRTASAKSAAARPAASGGGPTIGMIDGGVAGAGPVQRGFAAGAPKASGHGSAVASLILGQRAVQGVAQVRGAAPDARLLVADVYGGDPAGGSATAIVRALGWLVGERAPVVTISLAGPSNPLLARVVAAAQARGTIIVAAVGNDGPAAPFAYPASYPGVIAVTAVDARRRVLMEAGRATHLDYAAPGADMIAADGRGGVMAVRGTSFAAPLVAATIAHAYPRPDPGRRRAALAMVDAAAEKLGRRYGRGLLCGKCATLK